MYGGKEVVAKPLPKSRSRTISLFVVKEAFSGTSLDESTFNDVVRKYYLTKEDVIGFGREMERST